jgi:PAS domain S-box-containing protein/TyrR family helix-turn-helix protein
MTGRVVDRMIAMSQNEFLDDIPMGIVFLDAYHYILEINKYACEVLHCHKEGTVHRSWFNKFPKLFESDPARRSGQQNIVNFKYGNVNFVLQIHPLFRLDKKTGYIFIFQKAAELEDLTRELDLYRDISSDLQAIFDISYDVIYVSDGNGVTLRVSSACEKLWGYRESDIVGKSVYELEKKGVYKPSVTRLVLERGEKVSVIQTTKTGRRLMVVGTPIKDHQGKIVRIVNASRDITEESKLQAELDELRKVTEGYKQELMELRKKDEEETNIVYRSSKMRNIISLAQKVSKVDATVMLTGDSGVGKEVIASFIHKWSTRQDKPFVIFNCATLSEQLLETELFGTVDSLTDGITGKKRFGLFDMAHEGTLYLDEVCNMPLSLQAKLLKVLEDMEIVRVGGTSRIKLDVRIIASTNRNLAEEIASGRFRSDLYYRLNVIPISIPPLNQRKEDILALTLHFMAKFNGKYGLNKKFSSTIIEKLQAYPWPGNVRELRNTVESMLLMTNGDVIGCSDLPKHIEGSLTTANNIQVNDIVPLKNALNTVEGEILQLTYQKYGSTTKMAEALGVNQSTISRKLKKYKIGQSID